VSDLSRWNALIARYIAGASTPAEEAELQALLDQMIEGAQRTQWLAATRQRVARGALASVDADAALARVHSRIAGGSTRYRRMAAVAAAACVVIAVGLVTVWRVAHPVQRYATAVGVRSTITLSDGTRLVLAPASTLDVMPGYSHGHRDVRLNGRAYFDVVHDPARPFTVRAGEMLARDVGTTFGVSAYANQANVELDVVSGAVAVGNMVMTAHMAASVDARGALHVRRDADVDAATRWVAGRITLRDVPVREVLAELSRWYPVQFVATDTALLDRRATIDLDTPPLDELFRTLDDVLAVEARQSGSIVTLTPR
jgi:transmembrane sensor